MNISNESTKKSMSYEKDFFNYDLKLEMLQYKKIQDCLEDVLQNINYKLSLEEIFDNESNSHYLERYLLFRIQGGMGFKFDCDKTKIVKNFYKNKFGYDERYTDTLISMQYIWGLILRNMWKMDIDQKIDEKLYEHFINEYGYIINKKTDKKIPKFGRAQKFIYELIHLEEIKEVIGDKLYSKFEEYAHFYHTIGNISPCPKAPFNGNKGFETNCYDRLDLFVKTEKFKKHKDWIKWFEENQKVYHLENFINNDLGTEFLELIKDIEKRKSQNIEISNSEIENVKEQCCNYIDKVINIMKERRDFLESV